MEDVVPLDLVERGNQNHKLVPNNLGGLESGEAIIPAPVPEL